jgi:DNA-binding transcriptional LysR family regulator
MERRHLRYFTAVAEHLNFPEASRRPTRHQSNHGGMS